MDTCTCNSTFTDILHGRKKKEASDGKISDQKHNHSFSCYTKYMMYIEEEM